MDPFTIFAIIASVTGAASVIESVKAGKNQRKAQKVQRDADNLRAAREKRDAIRQGMIAQATAEQAANNQGVSTSSGALGGQGSIISQADSSVKWLDTQQQANNLSGIFMDKASKASSKAATFGAVSDLSMTAISAGWVTPGTPVQTAKPPSFGGGTNYKGAMRFLRP